MFYFGAAYYPEDWDESEQAHDIAMMVKAGINVVRIGEFAWAKMEPQEGAYDFSWMHRVMEKLGGTYSGPDIAPTEATEETTEETVEEVTADTTAETAAPATEETTVDATEVTE